MKEPRSGINKSYVNSIESALRFGEKSLNLIRCKYKNRLSQHFCWNDGWSRDVDDSYCVTTCSDPNISFDEVEWSCDAEDQLDSGRYQNGASCSVQCNSQKEESDLQLQLIKYNELPYSITKVLDAFCLVEGFR
jgi:hypothetical protein